MNNEQHVFQCRDYFLYGVLNFQSRFAGSCNMLWQVYYYAKSVFLFVCIDSNGGSSCIFPSGIGQRLVIQWVVIVRQPLHFLFFHQKKYISLSCTQASSSCQFICHFYSHLLRHFLKLFWNTPPFQHSGWLEEPWCQDVSLVFSEWNKNRGLLAKMGQTSLQVTLHLWCILALLN